MSLPPTKFPCWNTPKSLPGGAQQLIPLPKCCCYPKLPKTFRAGALTAQIVNFSEFQPFPPTFQPGSSAPGQGCGGTGIVSLVRGSGPSQPCKPGSSLLSRNHRELDTDPQPWGDLQDPTLPLCPLPILPYPLLHLKRVSAQSDSLQGRRGNFEDSCDLRAVSEQREKEGKSKELL